MASRDRRVLAQQPTTREGWLPRGELPAELRQSTARRLGVLGLLTAATFVVIALTNIPQEMRRAVDPALAWIPIACSNCAIVLSLLMFGIWRWRRHDPALLLGLAVPYQIAMAVIIGVADNFACVPAVAPVRGWSGVAVWIFVFAVFVPSRPIRTLWVSCVVALMDPLGLLVNVMLGKPAPPAAVMPQLFAPSALAVVTAVIASRIGYRLQKRLQEAREIGSYRLLELLGKGGMGEVWRAEHKMLARPAAIKLIRPDALGGAGGEAVRRFEREAQATALLQSENTIELYDFGVATDGSFYYVMELLDGMDLDQLVKRFGPMPPERAVFCLLQICDSLAEAHAAGLIHRDIKPSNIYLCQRGLTYDRIKVLDFGLVKTERGSLADAGTLTAEGSFGGTPAYAVPEIVKGAKAIDGRADLYAVGCVAYWLLSGQLVFEADTPMMAIANHVHAEPVRVSERSQQEIPPALDAIVHACLQKEPRDRPGSALELRQRLAALELAPGWTQQAAESWWRGIREPAAGAASVDPLGETVAP